jgi:hypothetical protein
LSFLPVFITIFNLVSLLAITWLIRGQRHKPKEYWQVKFKEEFREAKAKVLDRLLSRKITCFIFIAIGILLPISAFTIFFKDLTKLKLTSTVFQQLLLIYLNLSLIAILSLQIARYFLFRIAKFKELIEEDLVDT